MIKIWRRRIIGLAVAVVFLLFAASFFGSAIVISRINSLIAKSDALLETDASGSEWRSFLNYPVQSWFVERVGYGDALKLRKVYVLLEDGKTDEATTLLQDLADSENHKIASFALNMLGVIVTHQATTDKDDKMFELARQMFAKASVLDPSNEDAKHNLELLSQLRRISGSQPGENRNSHDGEDSSGNLPLDELPGNEGGKPGEYSGY